MSRVIGVLSGKGGVGKTTVVANLGAALTNIFNQNVLIFDSNISTSHLGLHLGMYEDLPVTLREVLKGQESVLHAVHVHPSTGIRLLPAPLSGDGLNLTKNKCCQLVDEVKNNYDMVILDCAPGLGKEVMTQISAIDEALIITTPDLPALTDAIKTAEIVTKMGKKVAGIVLNRHSNSKYELTTKEIESTINYSIIGTVPDDKRVPESIFKGVPVVMSFPSSPASLAMKRLGATLIGVEYRGTGFLERVKQLFGKRARATAPPGIAEQQTSPEPAEPEPPVPEDEAQSKEAEVEDVGKLREGLRSEIREELKRKVAKRLEERAE